MQEKYILAIDQGTTSSRAMIFNSAMRLVGQAQQEFTQHFPGSGWVEHDPEEIWQTVVSACKQAIQEAGISAQDISGMGITNQRETVVAWNKKTGRPLYNALVWQDRRTAAFCQQLKERGLEEIIQSKTGLLLDPYFSASKITWLLNNVPVVKKCLNNDDLYVGTIDTFLIYRLTGKQVHATDVTNASRTQLFNIHSLDWDDELLNIFEVPKNILPKVKACDAHYGETDADILGASIPICGVAGDQQAALIGQACFEPGDIKSTYGTGCFALINTGEQVVVSKHRLLTTVAYQVDGKTAYALEGSVFIAGAAVQWLRDGLKIIEREEDSEACAMQADEHQDLYLVPAFTGLGAPYWNADARGALFGLTRASGINEICRATLESVVYQTCDLFDAMQQDMQVQAGTQQLLQRVRVDGGMTNNDWLMQFLADMLDVDVEKPVLAETTVLGAAYLAGNHLGLYPKIEEFKKTWRCDAKYAAKKGVEWREERRKGWKSAVESTLNFQS